MQKDFLERISHAAYYQAVNSSFKFIVYGEMVSFLVIVQNSWH